MANKYKKYILIYTDRIDNSKHKIYCENMNEVINNLESRYERINKKECFVYEKMESNLRLNNYMINGFDVKYPI